MSGESVWTPADVVGAVFSVPITSLGVAVFVALVAEAWMSRAAGDLGRVDAGSVRTRYRAELIAAAAIAVSIVIAHLGDFVLRSYVLDMSASIAPLRFALPALVAAAGFAVLAVLVVRRGSGTLAPTLHSTRRTWTSFSRRRDLASVAVVATALVATTVAAGLASSTDPQGLHVWLEIPVPNVDGIDPLRVHFYGWAYGVPVLLATVALLIALAVVLRVNAARAFLRPETVLAERRARQHLAASVTHITAAALILALAGACRLIAAAGSTATLVVTGVNDADPYEVAWRHAEIAAVAGAVAPLLEIVAYTMLLLAAIGVSRRLPVAARASEMAAPIGSDR